MNWDSKGESENNRIFVYGTLRSDIGSGMSEYLLRNSTFLGAGTIRGEMYDFGSYPGVFDHEYADGLIVGEVYSIRGDAASEVWIELDRYEGCSAEDAEPQLYRRRLLPVDMPNGSIEAWVYVLPLRPYGPTRIPHGDYAVWLRERYATQQGGAELEHLHNGGNSAS